MEYGPVNPLLGLVLWVFGHDGEEGVWIDDGDAAEGAEIGQVVAGDDEIRIAFHCTGQYLRVVRVVFDRLHFHHS